MTNESEDRDIERWLLQARIAAPDPSFRARVLRAGAVRSRWPPALSMTSLAGVLIAVMAAGGSKSSSDFPNPSAPAAVEAAGAAPAPVPGCTQAAQPVARPGGGRRGRAAQLSEPELSAEPALPGAFRR